MLCRAKASSVSQVGLDAVTIVVLFFVTGGVSFCSGVDAPEVLDSEPKVTPPSLVYTPSDLTSRPFEPGGTGSPTRSQSDHRSTNKHGLRRIAGKAVRRMKCPTCGRLNVCVNRNNKILPPRSNDPLSGMEGGLFSPDRTPGA